MMAGSLAVDKRAGCAYQRNLVVCLEARFQPGTPGNARRYGYGGRATVVLTVG